MSLDQQSLPSALAEAIASANVLPDGFGAIAGRLCVSGRGACVHGSVYVTDDMVSTVDCGAPRKMSSDHRGALTDLNLAIRLVLPGGPRSAFGVDPKLAFHPDGGRFDPIGERFVTRNDPAETTIRVRHRHLSEVVRSVGKTRITHAVLACRQTDEGVLSTVLQRIVRNGSGGIESHQHLTVAYTQVERRWFPERVRTITSDNSGTSMWEATLTELAIIKIPDSPSEIGWSG